MAQEVKRMRIIAKEYEMLDHTKKVLVQQIGDGSIIKRFDKTPLPVKPTDVVCPYFLELKWATGCPFDCAWCYLKGTLNLLPQKTKPTPKEYKRVEAYLNIFLKEVQTPEVLNTGEIADSLMYESHNPFSKFIMPLFEAQEKHKALFVTKSTNIRNLLEIEPHRQTIVSFSLNAEPVAKRWEKAPSVTERIKAAKRLNEKDYEVRIRIDPMVPIKGWKKHYLRLIDQIFQEFVPERITLGSLRGLKNTIRECEDKSWVEYLSESSNWGGKVKFQIRYKTYSEVISYLKERYKYDKVALCKETTSIWQSLGMDYQTIKCNCVW